MLSEEASMDNPPVIPIRLVIQSAAAPDVAWAYLTEPERVAEWFTGASPVGEIGDPYVLDFGDGSVVEGAIVELEVGRRFSHRWAWLDSEPRQETLVTWIVHALDAGGSEVELLHAGWDEAGADSTIRDDHEAYWSGYLDDLRDLLDEAARA
jgi:uncharacterized protein YndB with AHSA1/START domain